MATKKRHWLMKSEPDVYSIDDLMHDGKTSWEGVRNYQARNLMRDEMKKGDLVLFYHSNAKPSGIAGIARICREAYPDSSAWDAESTYFDPKASPENPIWVRVDVEFVEKFEDLISLERLRKEKSLRDMLVLRRGMRLSVQPVEDHHYKRILEIRQKVKQS